MKFVSFLYGKFTDLINYIKFFSNENGKKLL